MIYADYDYYLNEYYGRSISAEDFPRLALRGSQYIDYITQGRAEANAGLEAVKMCCCELAEKYQTIDAAKLLANKSLTSGTEGSMEVQSESVGGWSRSYRAGGDSAQAAAQAAAEAEVQLMNIAKRHLAITGLLYRGSRRCR